MSESLLLIAIGPVQDFIAAARRTRDLWYGSHLLAELSRTAARELVRCGATLVFPALAAGDAELEPCTTPLRPSGERPLSVANKLIAELPAGLDPEEVARAVRTTVMTFWEATAMEVKLRCSGLLATGTDPIWDEQVSTFLDFAATWAAVESGYSMTLEKLEAAINGRKNLRNFTPWRHSRGAVPKSTLDGARETVLRRPADRNPILAGRYRIGDLEQLDAIGLVKRAGGQPNQFVPIVNVAFAPWLIAAEARAPGKVRALETAAQEIGLASVQRRDLPCGRAFLSDASLLLTNRWSSIFKELGIPGDANSWGSAHVGPLLRDAPEPYPYVACLVADGDSMGRTIQQLATVDAHRRFSRELAAFAIEARKIVEERHIGALIYAGGDDVLAFMPLSEAFACAEDLRRTFASVMGAACPELGDDERPTISVGIGIGHVMESMGDLLTLGREAEGLAKRGGAKGADRNALAVVLEKRSGDTLRWRTRWSDWSGDPLARIIADATLLRENLSSKKVYEIASLLTRLPKPAHDLPASWTNVLVRELDRCLARTHAGESALCCADVGLDLDRLGVYAQAYAAVSAWINRLLIVRTIMNASPAPNTEHVLA